MPGRNLNLNYFISNLNLKRDLGNIHANLHFLFYWRRSETTCETFDLHKYNDVKIIALYLKFTSICVIDLNILEIFLISTSIVLIFLAVILQYYHITSLAVLEGATVSKLKLCFKLQCS